MKKIITLTLISISVYSFSQSTNSNVVSTGGNFFDKNNISLSITIGEALIKTYDPNNIVLTQGFQQAIYNITDVSENNDTEIHISIFPNPTSEIVNIKCEEQNCHYKIINTSGNIFANGELQQIVTPINIANVPGNEFFIEIYSETSSIKKTYKIIKI